MAASSVDPGHKVVEQLRSLSEIPKLALFLLDAKDEDVYNYLFSEEAHRIQLLQILFSQIDDKMEPLLNSSSKKETEILDTLQNMCVSYGFSNRENSTSFIIGKMSLEKQCQIWKRIIEGVKSIMDYDNVVNELETDIMKVDMFFRNPFLSDFLSFMPKVTNQKQPPNYYESETLDCEIQNAKLKLENYKAMEMPSPEREKTPLQSNTPPILSEEQLLHSIQKWEIGFKNHLEENLSATSPDKTVEISSQRNNEKISQSIKTLRSYCCTIEKNLENRNLLTVLADRVKDHKKSEDEKS